MTMLIEKPKSNETESRGATFGQASGQYLPDLLIDDACRHPINPATCLQRPECDGHGGDLNDLGLMPAYSSYVNKEEVEDFLARKPHVVGILNELAPYLAEKYGIAEIKIEHTASEMHELDAVRVTPKFHTEDSRELIKLQGEILYDFFSSIDIAVAEDIIFSY